MATQAGTFTVANLYYAQPILNVISRDFGVSYERAASVATLSQAGYAAGLLFVCPLGDKVRRRPFVLGLVWLTATMVCFLGVFVACFFTLHFVASGAANLGTSGLACALRTTSTPFWPSHSSVVSGTSQSLNSTPCGMPAGSGESIC